MIKYIPELTDVVLEEIPDRVTLALEISNCQGSCPGCHSSFLKLDLGRELTEAELDRLIDDNFGINCLLLLGEGNDHEALLSLARHVRKTFPRIELALYSGRKEVEQEVYDAFDFVKVGPYVQDLGPLNEPTTNQRLYYHGTDITSRFWRKGLEKSGGQ